MTVRRRPRRICSNFLGVKVAKSEKENVELVGNSLLRRITVRDVVGKAYMGDLASHLAKASGKKLGLMRVIGVANRAKPGSTDKGDYVRFIGRFKATSLITGEIYQSSQCILPNFIGEQIHAAMTAGGAAGLAGLEAQAESQFAFDIGAHFEESSVTKYVYTVASLIPPSQTDALAMLEASIKVPQLALKAA